MATQINTSIINKILLWVHPKNQERNLISASFHMITITLISMSLVQLEWFEIIGGDCTPYLTLGEFFWFGYSEDFPEGYECINNTIVNMMRTIILWCFMAIIFSLGGFFLDIIGPRASIYFFIRRYALANTCTVLWVMAIISSCYYVTILLENSLGNLYPTVDAVVTYGYGFYLIAATGCVALIGTFCSLILMHTVSSVSYPADDPCLIDDYDDHMEPFNNTMPPPPYNIPPPPYAP